jgi:hypothetical protein
LSPYVPKRVPAPGDVYLLKSSGTYLIMFYHHGVLYNNYFNVARAAVDEGGTYGDELIKWVDKNGEFVFNVGTVTVEALK